MGLENALGLWGVDGRGETNAPPLFFEVKFSLGSL
jgi:hypothetical protein